MVGLSLTFWPNPVYRNHPAEKRWYFSVAVREVAAQPVHVMQYRGEWYDMDGQLLDTKEERLDIRLRALATSLLCRFMGDQCDHPLPISLDSHWSRYTQSCSKCGRSVAMSIRGIAHDWKMLYSVEHLRKGREADDRIRTYDLLITNQLLYRLSYVGEKQRQGW